MKSYKCLLISFLVLGNIASTVRMVYAERINDTKTEEMKDYTKILDDSTGKTNLDKTKQFSKTILSSESTKVEQKRDITNQSSVKASSESIVTSESSIDDQTEHSEQSIVSEKKVTDSANTVCTSKLTEKDWHFQLDPTDDTYKLISYLGTSTDIIVPNEINGKSTKIDLSNAIDLPNFTGNSPWETITSVTFSNANGKKVKAYNGFKFMNWNHLTTMDISGLDTSNITTMSHAFDGCIALKNIDVSNLNTTNVTDMSYMFANSGIESIDFTSNAKENVENMSYMFSSSRIKTVTFGKANQSWKLKNTFKMFASANELNSVDTQNWNVDNLKNAGSMFYITPNLTSVDVTGWNTSKLNNIERMFQACGATSISGLSDWNTSNIQYMGSFLQGCNLTGSLDLSKWNVSKVEQMWWMFAYTSNLTSLNITGWNTSIVTRMDKMFYGDSNLSSIIGLGNLTTDNVKDINEIFNRSPKLTFLDLTNWNISKAMDNNSTNNMFYTENSTPLLIVTNDKNLKNYNYTSDNRTIAGPKFVGNGGKFVSSVAPNTSTENYYLESCVLTPKQYADKLNLNTWEEYKDSLKPIKSGCEFQSWSLTDGNEPMQSSDLLNQITYTAEWIDWHFKLDPTDNTYKLISYLGTSTDIIVPNEINGKPTKIDLSSAIDLPNFTGNSPWETITSVTFSNANGKKVKAYNGFKFMNWNHLTTMDISGLDTSGVTTMTHAFDGCTALKSLDTSGLLTTNVTDMSYMFANSGIESIDLSSCTLFQVQNMKSMFEKSQVKMVKLGNGGSQPWKVTNMEAMFAYSPNLTSVDTQNWNVDNLENAYLMFADTTSLVNVNLTGWNTKNLKNMSRMFQSCRATSIPGMSDLNTANVTDMACLLQNSSISGSLDLTKWDTSRVIDMRFMFSGIKLTSLNVSNWNTSNVTDMTYMFAESLNLTFLDLRSWNTSNASNSMDIMFQTKNKQVPLLIVTNDRNLKSYNYTSDNRIIAGPKFVGNGGTFVSSIAQNTSTENYYLESYVLTPKQYADKLNLNTWKAYKDSLKPIKSGSVFQSWYLTSGNEPMQSSDLLNQITYTANWLVNSNIPSNNIDNVILSPVTSYGIAYIPKQFSFNSTPLNDQGNQMIPFERKNSFHVGVRDMRNTDKQWTLEAQLIWDKGKELTGAKIITTNNGTVKKNINDGTRPFEAVIDLVNCPLEEIEAKPNVVIESGSSQAIMTAKKVVHDAVYDYDLGNVSLEIPETKSVRPGEYIGHINWQLINAPKGS